MADLQATSYGHDEIRSEILRVLQAIVLLNHGVHDPALESGAYAIPGAREWMLTEADRTRAEVDRLRAVAPPALSELLDHAAEWGHEMAELPRSRDIGAHALVVHLSYTRLMARWRDLDPDELPTDRHRTAAPGSVVFPQEAVVWAGCHPGTYGLTWQDWADKLAMIMKRTYGPADNWPGLTIVSDD